MILAADASNPNGWGIGPLFADPLVEHLARFVRGSGLKCAPQSNDVTAFPGLAIASGRVVVDERQVIHPGDVLHEAGHIAITEAGQRYEPTMSPTGGQELSALAWSYAAVVGLGGCPWKRCPIPVAIKGGYPHFSRRSEAVSMSVCRYSSSGA